MVDVDQDMFMEGHAITTKTLAGRIARNSNTSPYMALTKPVTG